MELLVVLVIGSILVTVAVSQFGRSNDNLNRQNIAREFKVSLERARYDSVKRRASSGDESTVTVISPTSFSYTIDLNQNGRLDTPGETLIVDFGGRGDVTITGTNFVFPIAISFDSRGAITVLNGTTPPVISPIFYFCNGTCTVATATGANANKVYVSPTGTVAMINGGDVFPGFSNPPVTTVSNDSGVNPLLAVWTDTASSPTATPTPSPTSTPTATPTPAPTGSPAGTPSPTPAPVACQFGQRPSNTGCICQSPMWIRNNGQCK